MSRVTPGSLKEWAALNPDCTVHDLATGETLAPMSRITRAALLLQARSACQVLGLEPEELWIQHSLTGWHCYRSEGHGARALAECLTAREMDAFLRGVIIGADPR